jgi:uncharacterized protein
MVREVEQEVRSMAQILESEEDVAALVRRARVVAVVGQKGEEQAESVAYQIPRMIQAHGLRVIPVNPKLTESLGEKAYARIADVPERADIVDVFRRAEVIGALADEILALAPDHLPGAVWLQSGIVHQEAAARLAAGGIDVVMDRCLGVYVSRYRRG